MPAPAAGAAAAAGAEDSNTSLWRSLLREAAAARPPRLPTGTVLFLGDLGAGKTRLVQRFCGATAPPQEEAEEEEGEGSGTLPPENHGRPLLSYSFFDAVDPGEEGGTGDGDGPSGEEATAARVNVWSLSDPAYQSLLGGVLTPAVAGAEATGDDGGGAWQALSRTVCLIGLDLTRPWTFERALTRWPAVLRRALREAARAAAEKSCSSDEDVEAAAEAGMERLRARVAEYLGRCYDGGEAVEGGVFSVKASTPLKQQQQSRQRGRMAAAAATAELPEGVLQENVGVPLIVVGLKADSVKTDSFEAEQRVQFAQRFLRAFCLRHGAALVFTSAAQDTNRRLLQRYLLHRMYPEAFPFSLKAQARKEALFVPAGWDSPAVVAAIVSPNAPWPADAPFAEVIAPPKAERGRWDPFPNDDDEEQDEEQEEAGVRAEWVAGLVQPDAEWVEALGRHVEQQLNGAAAAVSAGAAGEEKGGEEGRRKAAAGGERSSSRRKEAVAASTGAGGEKSQVQSFFEGLLAGK